MVLNNPNGYVPTSLPALKGQNCENWFKEMKVILCCQDLWDLVKEGVTPLEENAADEEMDTHKKLKKKDYKVLFIIHQCVDFDNFEKLSDVDSVKEA